MMVPYYVEAMNTLYSSLTYSLCSSSIPDRSRYLSVSYPSRYYDTKSDTNVEMWNYQLGYWLEDIYNPTQGRAINNTGLITHSEGWIYNYYGVRPVITVPKTILN